MSRVMLINSSTAIMCMTVALLRRQDPLVSTTELRTLQSALAATNISVASEMYVFISLNSSASSNVADVQSSHTHILTGTMVLGRPAQLTLPPALQADMLLLHWAFMVQLSQNSTKYAPA